MTLRDMKNKLVIKQCYLIESLDEYSNLYYLFINRKDKMEPVVLPKGEPLTESYGKSYLGDYKIKTRKCSKTNKIYQVHELRIEIKVVKVLRIEKKIIKIFFYKGQYYYINSDYTRTFNV